MRIRCICAVVTCALLAGCGGGTSNPTRVARLSGAGSTFDGPFFSKAFALYSLVNSSATIDYKPIGSSSGVQDFLRGSVDFGATDIPMDAALLSAYPGGADAVVQLPITLGGIVIAYNVPGLTDEYSPHRMHLRLTPDLVGRIFLGSVKSWNDPAIAALNAGVKLPSLPITVVNRADASGTTSVFSDYLDDSSPAWKARARRSETADVRALAAKSNAGAAGRIMNARGTIGYIEMAYALSTTMNYAAIRNRAGNFVLPSMKSVRAAAAQQPEISQTDFYIDDLGGATSYPIAGYSWLIIERKNPDPVKAAALCSFARWMLTDGQKVAPSVGYVPLPTAVATTALAALGPCAGGS